MNPEWRIKRWSERRGGKYRYSFPVMTLSIIQLNRYFDSDKVSERSECLWYPQPHPTCLTSFSGTLAFSGFY